MTQIFNIDLPMIIRQLLLSSLLLLHFSVEASEAVRNSVNHPARPEADIKRDANRKPEEVLSFFGVRPGMKVLDVYATGGYYTEILSRIVGEKGKVVAHNSKAYRKFVGQSFNDRYLNNRLANVDKIFAHPREVELEANDFDMVLLILIYHDLYVTNAKNLIRPPDRRNLLTQVFKSLKPGGTLGIVDHVAPRSSGVEAATTWHRLSSSIVLKELTEMGFEFVEESTALRNRADPKDISIFDPSIRRKTDRYVLKFRKPL